MEKGSLLVDNHPYQSSIVTPDDQKLLKLKTEEITELKKIHVVQGETIKKKTSQFTGFVCDVQSYEEVNSAYEWVRYHNMDAHHIICACILPDTGIISSYDCNDDEEHEAGPFLLDFMVKTKLKNQVVYVVHHYDGKHIGQDRFEGILEVAKSAINLKPFNSVTESFQFAWEQQRGKRHRPSKQTKPKSHRQRINAGTEDDAVGTTDPGSTDEEILLQHKTDSRPWAERTPPHPGHTEMAIAVQS